MRSQQEINRKTKNKTFKINKFNKQHLLREAHNKRVNIFASGPSISEIEFNESLLIYPSIFVNGSLSLIEEYYFCDIVGYVISDDRFIKHNAKLLEDCYSGQPLYITQNVLESIAEKLPNTMSKYHNNMRLISSAVNIMNSKSSAGSTKLPAIFNKFKRKDVDLVRLKNEPNFVIDSMNKPKPIGVSLNIEDGFIEAGTVAYIAAQLAFTIGASEIHLYGIDLINNSSPRFYESRKDAAPCKLDKAIINRIVPSFDLLAREYFKRGVRVINHSPVSKDLFKDILFNY